MDIVSIKKEILYEINRGGCSCVLIEKHLGTRAAMKYSSELVNKFPEAKLNENTIQNYIREKKLIQWEYPRYYELAEKVRARLINQFFKREYGI